jgi:NRAMP (natural resistance-associated macrophage protein)-like metal ion transporter
VVGPGLIVAAADNDAGGITTYSVLGAQFGYSFLWIFLILLLSLAITQEMGARAGIVTGKGLASLIRERFGVRWTAMALLATLLANLGTTVVEFAGIAASLEIFGLTRYVSVPLAALLIFLLVTRGNYKRVERIFLVFSMIYLSYVISGVLAQPDWDAALRGTFIPSFRFDGPFVLTFIATVGTTITPWGQFFIQSYVVDKRLAPDELNAPTSIREHSSRTSWPPLSSSPAPRRYTQAAKRSRRPKTRPLPWARWRDASLKFSSG